MTGGLPDRARPDTDDRLVRLMIDYQAGSLEAFEELYALLAGDLLRHLQAASRDGLAQDLMQETFLELHRTRRTYLQPLPVRPWVFGVARNVLRRHRRTAWRQSRREDAGAARTERGTTPASTRHPALEERDIEEALGTLSAPRRSAWELHHRYGFSFEEISRMLQIPVGAAKLRSSRAMNALRDLLGVVKGGPRG